MTENNEALKTVDGESSNYHKPKERFDMQKKDIAFLVTALLLSIFLVAFGFFGGLNIGFSVTAALLFIASSLYLKGSGGKATPFSAVCAVLSVLLLANFSITSGGAVRFFSFLGIAGLWLIWFTSLSQKAAELKEIKVFRSIFLPISDVAAPNFITPITSAFSGEDLRKKAITKALLGVALALPVLLLLVPLLMSSDVAFSALVESAVDNLAKAAIRIVLGVIVAFFVIGYFVPMAKIDYTYPSVNEKKKVDNVIIIAFLSVISAVYLVYLFSQLAYFFSAFSSILPEGYSFTAADYARRGFFEMCAIALINFILIYGCLLLGSKKNSKISVAIRSLCSFIGAFSLMIIATAASKMVLYIKRFGMTELRITTSAFMLFLTVVFFVLIARLHIKNAPIIKTAIITAAVVLIALGTINVNAVVADYNYRAYKNGKLPSLDVEEFYTVGDEGVPYLTMLAESGEPQIAKRARALLSDIIYYEEYYDGEFTLTESKEIYKISAIKQTKLYGWRLSYDKAITALDKYIAEHPEALEFPYETEQY